MKLAYQQDVYVNGKQCYVFTADGFARESYNKYHKDSGVDMNTYVKDKVEQEIKRFGMHMAYQFTRHSGVLSSDKSYYEREAAKWSNAPRLNVGDIVEVEGMTFKITKAPNDNFGLELV